MKKSDDRNFYPFTDMRSKDMACLHIRLKVIIACSRVPPKHAMPAHDMCETYGGVRAANR